jgi:hydroxymethylpyrimidine/phosphomethylpyrimidine kinase
VTPPVALTIAGSDPSGGAGIQADLKTFHQHGAYGASVLTLLTVQNTIGVSDVRILEPAFVSSQLTAVLGDLPVQAAKTGALGSRAIVESLAHAARNFAFPLVVDPVMISKHGASLMDSEARSALVRELLPVCTLITPNLHEAAAIIGISPMSRESLRDVVRAILDLGAPAVLLKGGHRDEIAGEDTLALDVLATQDDCWEFPALRVRTRHTHGTGCSYSAAITAQLAKGLSLFEAVARSKKWIHEAIRTNPGLGAGQGPVNHFTPAV